MNMPKMIELLVELGDVQLPIVGHIDPQSIRAASNEEMDFKLLT